MAVGSHRDKAGCKRMRSEAGELDIIPGSQGLDRIIGDVPQLGGIGLSRRASKQLRCRVRYAGTRRTEMLGQVVYG
ncbi:hypothetical protein GOP47_0014900 [Adiantum capillus-veneris]|uniref:Uncharacterized protein n=1 Tax=Adiantum capillus-veneris TaxID=13818 RepID=A0A9D4UN83_ADICA|nr:hypothetical protein GOP47_0014900 [Adiantum capillus-veneris]